MKGAPHLTAFLEAAQYFLGVEETSAHNNTFPIGSRGNEIFQLYGGGSGVAWCAIFVSACAKKADVLGTVSVKSSWARGICQDTVNQCGGEWIPGPGENGGVSVVPQPGDLILFRTGAGTSDFHVGIVERADDATVYTIEGNSGNACRRKSYDNTNGRIYAYVRPDWSRVGDDVKSYGVSSNGVVKPLYSIRSTRHDMTMRDVCYLDSNYKLSSVASNVRIAAINYTSLLGGLYAMLAPVSYGTPSVDVSNLDGNLRSSFEYLLTKGFNSAAVAGICGNIQAESNFNPSVDVWDVNGMSAGICQWHLARRTAMINYVGTDWQTNLSGQLDYLCDELQNSYSTVYNTLMNVDDSIEGTKVAADTFVRKFEVPANVNQESLNRQQNAVAIYQKVVGG